MELVRAPTFTRGHQCITGFTELWYELTFGKLLNASGLEGKMKLSSVRRVTDWLGLTSLEVTPLNETCSITIASISSQ